MKYCLKHGNCLDILKAMKANSVDSVVTDPPYGLSFMNKKWDYDVPSVEVWEQCLRVLKPGGHALIACGTKTQHRMVCNIEDAGFEIRDVVSWIYGSGFPKSQNISKAIDKQAGAEREYICENPFKRSDKTEMATKGKCQSGATTHPPITAPATDEAKQWEGWGTALKPACEFWTLCRKPISEKTIAANVLKHGTGGINIEGCRVQTKEKLSGGPYLNGPVREKNMFKGLNNNIGLIYKQPSGRWPANLIHDGSDEVVNNFPESKTASKANKKSDGRLSSNNKIYGNGQGWGEHKPENSHNDSGSAARFFYCAKTSQKERGEGNNHPTVKPIDLMKHLCRLVTPPNGIVLDPFMGSGSTGVASLLEGFRFGGIEMDKDYFAIANKRLRELL